MKEASERAILTLRSLQMQYVSAVRSATSTSSRISPPSTAGSNISGGSSRHPSTKLFRSQDVLRPFLLACNYPDANAKLLTIGLNAIQLLLSGDAVCPDDSTHIIRVLVIQASVSASIHEAAHPSSVSSHAGSSSDVSPTKQSATSSSLAGSMMNAVGLSSYSSGGGSHARTLKEDEAICMKVLQTLTMVVASKDLVLGEEVLAQCIMVCLTLIGAGGGFAAAPGSRTGKDGVRGILKKTTQSPADKHGARVKRAAVGTLKQTLSLVFDRALSEQQQEDESKIEYLRPQQAANETISKEEIHRIKQSTRHAAAGAFSDLCVLAESTSDNLDAHESHGGRNRPVRLPHKEMHGPFSQGLLASSFGGGGSSRQNLQFIQMPPRATCFELLDMVLSQTPSLFVRKQARQAASSLEDAEPLEPATPLRRHNSVDTSLFRDKSHDFPRLLRTKACPLVTTTLLSELTIYTAKSARDLVAYGEQNIANLDYTEEADLHFSLLVRCSELASTIIHEYGEIQDLSGECHILITALIRYIRAATEGYQNADGFEDGYIYSSSQFFLEHGAIENSGTSSTSGKGGATISSTAGGNAVNRTSTKRPHLVSNMLLWRAGLAMEAIQKAISSPSLVLHLHKLYSKQTPLIAAVAQAVSDFCIIAASNEDSIRSVVASSSRRSPFDSTINVKSSENDSKIGAKAREYAKFFDEWDSIDPQVSNSSLSIASSGGEYATLASLEFVDTVPACDEGEAIWLAIQCILKLLSSVNKVLLEFSESGSGSDDTSMVDSVVQLVDCTFVSCLAVLQHILKRFSGCTRMVECALVGYEYLAHSAMLLIKYNAPKIQSQRKALLTTLCKLALPMLGRNEVSSTEVKPMYNHNVVALHSLFRIIHNNVNSIDLEWTVVLKTLERCSEQSIASPKLSNRVYCLSELIAKAYTRFPEFTICISSSGLQILVSSLVELSVAAATGSDMNRLLDDDDTPTLDDVNYFGPNSKQTGTSTSMTFFSLAGRALGVGTSIGSAESFGDPVVATDQNRAPRSKTYTSDLYAAAASYLLSSNKPQNVASTRRSDVSSCIPFSLVLLIQVALSNRHRFEVFCEHVIPHISALATECQLDVVRNYAMDMLAHLISLQFSDDPNNFRCANTFVPSTSLMSHEGSDFLMMVEPGAVVKFSDIVDEKRLSEHYETAEFQAKLITPLCLSIQSTGLPEGAECGLMALHMILENTGHDMKGECWPIIIQAIASCAGDLPQRSTSSWSTCGMRAFRCLKLVIDDFLDTLPDQEEMVGQAARFALLDCCASFGSSTHDVNTSLTAMGMLWTIADQDINPSSLQRVFGKLALLSCDSRAEVRNCGVNTLFSCVVGIGNKFTSNEWKVCFNGTLFKVLDEVTLHRKEGKIKDECRTRSDLSHEAPEDRYKVNVHHSRDSAEKQWAATQVLAMRGLERVLRQFFIPLLRVQYAEDTESNGLDDQLWFDNAWERILDLAVECASSLSGRDTLELRNVGVDLIILCCQLASSGGLEAAANPVRVSTNMQVINGALRSIGPTTPSRGAQVKISLNGSETDYKLSVERRYSLFIVAFEKLEFLLEAIDGSEPPEENGSFAFGGGSSVTQVMARITAGLTKIYECCKDDELSIEKNIKEDDLEARFVQLVQIAADKSSFESGSKILNQSQRGCLELLSKMSTNSSWRAFETLTVLGGNSFVL